MLKIDSITAKKEPGAGPSGPEASPGPGASAAGPEEQNGFWSGSQFSYSEQRERVLLGSGQIAVQKWLVFLLSDFNRFVAE